MGIKKEILLVKIKVYFYLYLLLNYLSHTIKQFFFSHDGENCDRSHWVFHRMSNCLFWLLTWSDSNSLGDCIHHDSSSTVFSKMGPFYSCCHHLFCCHHQNFYCCCFSESASVTLLSAFVAFYTSVEAIFVCTGWLNSPFEINYPHYHRLLAVRCWRDSLPLVPQYVLIANLYPPHLNMQHTSIIDGQCKNVVWMQSNFCCLYLFDSITKGLSCKFQFC